MTLPLHQMTEKKTLALKKQECDFVIVHQGPCIVWRNRWNQTWRWNWIQRWRTRTLWSFVWSERIVSNPRSSE